MKELNNRFDSTSSSNYLQRAEELFRPFGERISSPQSTKFQFVITFFKELFLSVPRYFQQKQFINDFSGKVFRSSQAADLASTPQEMLASCEKRLKKLNTLQSVYQLIAKNSGKTLPVRLDLTLKLQMIEDQRMINSAINTLENEKQIGVETIEPAAPVIEAPVATIPQETTGSETHDDAVPVENPVSDLSSQTAVEEDIEAQTPAPTEQSKPAASGPFSRALKRWSGVKDLTDGVDDILHGRLISGACNLATGSLKMALMATLTVCMVQGLAKGNTYKAPVPTPTPSPMPTPEPAPMPPPASTPIFIPSVDPSLIQSLSINPAKGQRKITMVTAYDEGIKDYAQLVIPNQRNFAALHGYDYVEYYGNLAHDNGNARAPYWSKIVALNDQLNKIPEGEWLAWLDASAVFTNSEKNFDQVIDRYGQDKDIIVTTDPMVPINNAVFLLRNTPWTRKWIQIVWSVSDLAVGGKGRCFSWGRPICHYEQQAMTEIWERSNVVKEHTAHIPNKVMNSFYRYSHYDKYRKMDLLYGGDPESSKWSSGDFICKVTGMDKDRRFKILEHVVNNCVDKSCQRIEF